MLNTFQPEKIAGLFLVLAIHGGLLYGAWSYKLIPPPDETVTLFVNLINPPAPKKEQERPEPPKPIPPQKVKLVKQVPIQKPQLAPVLVAESPVTSITDSVAPPPPPTPEPVAEVPAPVAAAPVAAPPVPLTLSSELSLACPDRSMPNYPALSRRMNEQGKVVIHVELDTTGKIISAKVEESSGFKRLDDAGLSAVKSWHCKPAMKNGEPVRAYALQPFDFILEGR